MSTQVTPRPAAVEARVSPSDVAQPDIKIYSHSPIFYWWPIWLIGFCMALLTYFDGGHAAYVPAGTVVEGNKLVAPDDAVLLFTPTERIAQNPYLGTVFFFALLIVFVSSYVQTRGLWEWIAILTIALVISLISAFGIWGQVLSWFTLIHIHVNLAGYLFLSFGLLAIWLASTFIFDRRTYIIFSAGQVRVLDHIGASEKVYDVTNMTFQVQPNILIRHRILGFWGAGDLIISTGGPHAEVMEWPNVLFARSRIKQIQERLKSREVV